MSKLINGKKIAEKILLDLKAKITKLDRPPGLAVVLIGNDPASKLYVNTKKKACQKVGIEFHEYLCKGKFCPNATEEEILEMIDFLNKDPKINAIIVQLPIPKEFDTQKIINQISPKKDVDGFHPENQKKFLHGKSEIIPPLIGAVDLALKETKENLAGKKAIIVGKNPIFYAALESELKHQGLNVETANPDDKDLPTKILKADVLVVIAGQIGLIKKSMIKKDAIIIDIGTNLIDENKSGAFPKDIKSSRKALHEWAGDVDPEVAEVAGWLTPVPGGIGPLTVAFLLKNVCDLAEKNQ